MRQIPGLDMPSNVAKFWRSYVHVGVVTYAWGAFAVLAYSLTSPAPTRRSPRRGRHATPVTAVG